ncbi:tetratricopeptide repeat protein [Lutimonas saemankumensis]|uniref:tetratricopeptide repeat protein n=1 Tax=Lutimonas saemankumensis TaxID=483016 RepID=UPI001CD30BB4|nr:tetratricopeptide repeat protein [Lutimonas saemankumensis]MCA0931621.1 tetratricopeptide repeat protein [Lutimonas saemankumensis]
MKNQILLLVALFMCTVTFAQKDEIKAAEKAIKKDDYAAAQAQIQSAESLIANADDKTKAKFYYLKGETYAGLAKTDPSAENYDQAASSFNALFDVEEKLGSSKYTTMAEPTLNTMISEVSAKGIKSYQDKNYEAAKTELHQVYSLSPRDTVYLEYAANAAYMAKDFDLALDYFTTLKDLGYTGIATEYTAVNVETGERENMGSKAQMDLMVKAGSYSDPKEITSESKQPTIIKNIAFVHVEKGDTEKAIAAVKDARKVAPEDVALILTEANLQIKLGNRDEFASLMSQAIELDPTNPTLYFNLGVIAGEQGESEKSKEYYKKAIELDPDYVDAYINLGSAILEDDKVLVEEMNKSLNDFDKYDEIKAKQIALYKEVIPVYEKAYSLRPNDLDTIRTLMSLYENTEMNDKFQAMKEKYDSMK